MICAVDLLALRILIEAPGVRQGTLLTGGLGTDDQVSIAIAQAFREELFSSLDGESVLGGASHEWAIFC